MSAKEYLSVPLDRFVLALAAGWRFPGRLPVAGPSIGHHGRYRVLMYRRLRREGA